MKKQKSVVTIGTFDGVHLGHRFLISESVKEALAGGLKSVVVMLERPVRKVSGLLTLPDEKIAQIKPLGADEIIILRVCKEILEMPAEEFFESFLIQTLNAKKIICGPDFAFGKNRKGNIEWLKAKAKSHDVCVCVAKTLKYGKESVSSSRIRSLLEKGDIKTANAMLGRPYSLKGVPFREKGLGAKIGFPTVNIKADKDKLLPIGVFVGLISQGESLYPAVISIGTRPTIGQSLDVVCETHILNFSGVWRKKESKVHLLAKLRDEKKFQNIEAMVAQLKKDKARAIKYFCLQK